MIITVSSKQEMIKALKENGLTPTPLPQGDQIEVGDVTILRDVVERVYECMHDVSTTRFPGEYDWCGLCNSMQMVVK